MLRLCNAGGRRGRSAGREHEPRRAGRCRCSGELVLDLRRLDEIGAGRRPHRPGDRAGRCDAGAAAAPGARRGLAVRRRPGCARRRDGRRHGRDERGRCARAALRPDAAPARRHRGGAGRRPRHPSPRRAREGQLRLRPRRSPLRQRGNARGRHRGTLPPVARRHGSRSWRCARSTTSTPRSTPSERCAASSTA